MPRQLLTGAVATIMGVTLATAPVAAQDGEDGPDVDVDVNIPMDEVIDAIRDFLNSFEKFAEGGGLEELLKDVLIAVFYKPFQWLAEALVKVLTRVITSYPDMTMADVITLHHDVFQLTLLLSVPAFMLAGYVYMFGPIFSIKEEHAKALIPRLLLALGFGAVAPWLLDYPVRLSEMVTVALRPADPGLWAVTQLISEMMITVVLNALFLLGVVIVFIVRDIYLLFAAAVAPLLALGWALPYARQYASPLIGAFWGFLIIGPLDMIIFRLVLALIEVDFAEIPHFLWALGGLVLMLAVPFVVLSAGASITGFALAFTYQAAGRTHRMAAPPIGQKVNPALRKQYGKVSSRWNDFRSEYRRSSSGNRFDLTSNGHGQSQSRNAVRQTSLREYGYERDSIYDPGGDGETDDSDETFIWVGENR